MNSTDSIIKPTGAIMAEMELSINAPRKLVWDSFVNETNEWWHKDFYTSKGPRKFVTELRLGGNMYEDTGDGTGLVWFTILGILPEKMLYVIGYARPPFGGPATGLINFELESKSESETLFKVSDASFGVVTENMVKEAQSGWGMLFKELKTHVESR